MEYVTLELLFQYSVAPFGYLDHQDSDAEHGLEKLLDEKAQSLIEILNQIDKRCESPSGVVIECDLPHLPALLLSEM